MQRTHKRVKICNINMYANTQLKHGYNMQCKQKYRCTVCKFEKKVFKRAT